jgi:hypothetical protein
VEGIGAIGGQGCKPIAPPARHHHRKPHHQAISPVIPVPVFLPLPAPEGIFFDFLKLFAPKREPFAGDPVRLLGRRGIHMPWNALKLIRRPSLPSFSQAL